jgi:hypothetical protein
VELPRRALARYLAPAAFLLALTIAVLLVRSGLRGDSGGATTPLTGLTRPRPAATTTARTTTRAKPAARFYTIQSGDTFETVAAKFGTTVDKLVALNPSVDPHALTVGQKVRVG